MADGSQYLTQSAKDRLDTLITELGEPDKILLIEYARILVMAARNAKAHVSTDEGLHLAPN